MAEAGGTLSCVGKGNVHCIVGYPISRSVPHCIVHILANTAGHVGSPCMQKINLHKNSTGNKVLMLVNECCSKASGRPVQL